MSALSEILRRARRLGVPGAAHSAGTPVDRVAVAEEELAALFATLAPYASRAQGMEEDAAKEADRLRREASEKARSRLAAARTEGVTVRSEATTSRLAELEEEIGHILAGAEQEARRIRAATARRRPELAARIVELAVALARTEPL